LTFDCNGAFIFVQFHAIHHICKLAITEPAMPSRLGDAVMNASTPTPRDNSSVAGLACLGQPVQAEWLVPDWTGFESEDKNGHDH
jgi:hypothetical protein